jgi:hypothetical protein
MKTDTVLTMNKYFDNACHIPITSEVDARSEEHGWRWDRRGHRACLEERKPRLCPAAVELYL